jgi:exopolyphosphatase / guanosine-5'-triphosphate,3'-diphosphate pyrophosphatase
MPDIPVQRVAAMDIGSNTAHMVVADLAGDRDLRIMTRQVELLRLGEDIAATGAISPERAARVETTLRQMSETAQSLGATMRLGLATEGVRAAANATEIITRFSAAWGSNIVLVSGLEEAALTFWGATSTITDPARRLGAVDLGGGSCEIVAGTIGEIASATSLQLGSGMLVDLLHPADPPTPDDMRRLKAEAVMRLAAIPPPRPPLQDVFGVGGTATALGRFMESDVLIMPDLDRAAMLLQSAAAKDLAAQRGADAGRVRLMAGGVAAWQALLEHLGAERMIPSDRGVREGAILAWAVAGADWVQYAHDAASRANA